MEVLTGLSDPHEAARQLHEWGVKEVIDATGCGDTYTIGYLYQRVSGAGIEEAGRFAAAMSTLKIERSGPFSGDKEDVIECIRTAEQMFFTSCRQ